MIRAPIGDTVYWEEGIEHRKRRLQEEALRIAEPSDNPTYRPQYVFQSAQHWLRYALTLYSGGTHVTELKLHFPKVAEAWELSNKLAINLNDGLKPGEGWDHRSVTGPRLSDDPRAHNDPRAWLFHWRSLNHYNWCFWLVGLALALEIPDDQWQRLLALIGNEGEDVLLDRVIASRQPGRAIGTALLHPKPYARLLKAVDAPASRQPALLRDFVTHWYAELDRKKGTEQLWWYIYGDPVKHPLEMGSYFGRWCIEAVAAVKAFGMDDSLCLGLEHYPGDLLRPDGPTTHPIREDAVKPNSWWRNLFSITRR